MDQHGSFLENCDELPSLPLTWLLTADSRSLQDTLPVPWQCGRSESSCHEMVSFPLASKPLFMVVVGKHVFPCLLIAA